MTVTDEPRTYGGWRRPASPGIWHLKLIPTIILFGAVLATVGISMYRFLYGVIFLAVVIVVAAPAVIPFWSRSVYAHWSHRRSFKRTVKKGQNKYISGLAGVTQHGTRSLPGLLAKVAVWEALDGLGRPFALIQIPGATQWAVVIKVTSQGGALKDKLTRDLNVAKWGQYLQLAGEEGGVKQVVVVGETRPGASAALAAHVNHLVKPDAPEFARQVMFAGAAEIPAGNTETTNYVAITFSEKGIGVDRSAVKGIGTIAAAVAVEIGKRLPNLTVRLSEAGAAAGVPLSAGQLGRRVHEAFDPAESMKYAELDAAGEPVEIAWDDAGPARHEEDADGTSYYHDSGRSCTWEALRVPPGFVTDQSMQRLLSPISNAPRTRVALIWRPVDAGNTAETVERDYKAALNQAGQRQLENAHTSIALNSAKQATVEEARGAGVGTFSLLVTTTVITNEDQAAFDSACRAVTQAGKSSRFRLSPVRGAQAAAFAGGLGIGLSLPDLSIIPTSFREHI